MANIIKCPVTIITGFLGAGKTTLLNRLVRDYPGKKFAVIENEFGEINIDSELAKGISNGIYELTNGCVCCTINDELEETLITIVESGFEFDHLLIETTGIADPNNVAATLLNEFPARHFALDGTICVADSLNLEKNAFIEKTAGRQIAFADLIILNKADMLNTERLLITREKCRELNPEAEIISTKECGYGDCKPLELKAFEKDIKPAFPGSNHTDIESYSLRIKEAIDPELFEYGLGRLLEKSGDELYRAKGIIYFENYSRKMIFQSVGNYGIMTEGPHWKPGEERQTKLVFIGRKLNKELINSILDELRI